MKKITLFSILLFSFQLFPLSSFGEPTSVKLFTEDSPPHNMFAADGKTIIGINADKVFEIMKRAKIPYTVELTPWARAYNNALTEVDSCVFTASRTEERESLFTWVGPLSFSEWAIYGLKETKNKPKKLEDLKDAKIGTYNQDAVEQYLKSQGYNIQSVSNDSSNPEKLINGRFDFWASGKFGADQILKKKGYERQIVQLFTFKKSFLYMACNKNLDPSLLKKMEAAMRSITKDGFSKKIDRKYEAMP